MGPRSTKPEVCPGWIGRGGSWQEAARCEEVTIMLIETIKADRLQAMKAKDELKKNLLGTLYAAATKETKTPDDAAVTKTIRSFLKAAEETIGLLEGKGLDAGPQRAEKAILEAYLPRALSEAELKASIEAILTGLPERSPKAMGQVMAALKERHGEALDSRAASALVRAALG
jgi:uncharacterized protein YqeY